jgi:hypothetical protein
LFSPGKILNNRKGGGEGGAYIDQRVCGTALHER